jgi:KipI family sensor histidine kinase inhibitor
MEFRVASVDSLVIYFGDEIGSEVAKKVRQVFYSLKEIKVEGITELIPSYTSLMISYDFVQFSYEQICEKIENSLKDAQGFYKETDSRSIVLPVYYGEDVGLDLADMAKNKGMNTQEIIDIHSQQEYFVYAIGFAPGFPYMGEVDESIASPRLANPRAKVPKGSVGIADRQTAVYPRQSPGGWNIIGRTPTEMFDTSYQGFSYFRVGDKVKFMPISKDEFIKQGGEL